MTIGFHADRGGCLDGIVTFLTRGKFGVETVVVLENGTQLNSKGDVGKSLNKPVLVLETQLDDNVPQIHRRIIKTTPQ